MADVMVGLRGASVNFGPGDYGMPTVGADLHFAGLGLGASATGSLTSAYSFRHGMLFGFDE